MKKQFAIIELKDHGIPHMVGSKSPKLLNPKGLSTLFDHKKDAKKQIMKHGKSGVSYLILPVYSL